MQKSYFKFKINLKALIIEKFLSNLIFYINFYIFLFHLILFANNLAFYFFKFFFSYFNIFLNNIYFLNPFFYKKYII